MSQDTQQQETITESQIEAAIQAVIGRGWDVNPYTVAEEARISPAEISHNAHFMQLIVHARGGEVTFAVKSAPPEELKRIAELEKENADLRAKLDAPEAKIVPDDDILNEQVKALLSSESDEQVKQLERELEQAYEQVVSLEEEKTDLTRSVAGLERVNDALNARMRQLEDEAVVLKKQASEFKVSPNTPLPIDPQVLQELESLKTQNAAMDEQIQQFIAISREKSEYIVHLESANYQHESLILELEAKLAELQQEADMLALQLQNAFNVGYQKGHSDSKPSVEDKSEDTGSEEVQSESALEAPLFPGSNPAHVATGEQPVMTPGQYYELHQQMPNVEIKTQPESEATPQVAASAPNTAPAQAPPEPGSWDTDRVLNFARTGPYVASNFNPLESLSWRDLETVYSMGVLSIKDFSRNLTEYRPTDPGPQISEPPQKQLDTSESYSQVKESIDVLGQAMDDTGATDLVADLLGEAPNPEGMDFIDELIDIDKLDIFESLEELEELGTIDVLGDPINLPDFESDANGRDESAEPASDDQLRDLIKSRISQAQEHKEDQDVRTPPAPEGAEDDPTKSSKPFPSLKKFVGQKGQDAPPPPVTASSTSTPSVAAKHTPPEIRKACMILGIRPEDLTKESVHKEWKKQITSVHPDLGGDTDSAVFLNTAKDTLLRWLDQNTPKLGEKFGSGQGGSTRFTGKNKPNDKS
ncbi:MAG: hypothetical protein K2X93_09820 [Candidatus Obscuribacterales bacterium]|nr:hypothetical protein [Candidatus Obscuribacterales bacterium]